MNAAAATTTHREILATRTFDAPRELVFRMWTDPKHIVKWWGPKGFTTTMQEMNVKPGGAWQFVMHGPDGADYLNKNVYVEIVEPERLVYDHTSTPKFRMTVTFASRGAKTEVGVQMLFESAELRDSTVKTFGAIEGLSQTLDRLTERLREEQMRPEFSITRVFDAPRELVWKAVTESDRLTQWWGPKSFTMLHCAVDLRPGGTFRYAMRMPDGREMWGKWVYREITPPEKLVTVVSFTDENGNPVRHPMSPTWPLEVLNTMTLTEQNGKTSMTVSGYPIHATEEELKAYDAGRGSMKQGFTGTFDQLEAYLARLQGGQA